MAPLVSVIIPVFNDVERLRLCLQALSRQTFPLHDVEVLVVDNASTEDVRGTVATFPFATYLHENEKGSYPARNKALGAAAGRLMLFTDSDCIPDADWIAAAVRAWKAYPAEILAGAVELFVQDPKRPTLAELYELEFGFPQEKYVQLHRFGVTANLGADKALFGLVGPFAKLRSGGDREWGTRAHGMGVALRFVPDMRVAHPARRSLAELRKKTRRITSGRIDRGALRIRDWRHVVYEVCNAIWPPFDFMPTIRAIAKRRGRWTAFRIFVLIQRLRWTTVHEMAHRMRGGAATR